MSFVELHVSASAFLLAQFQNIQSRRLSFPSPITLGPFQLVVDHVEFDINTLRHNSPRQYFIQDDPDNRATAVSGFQPQLTQTITVFLVDLADVKAHPNASPANFLPITATLVVNMDYFRDVDGIDDIFQISFAGVEMAPLPTLPPGIDPEELKKRFTAFASSLFPSSRVPLGLVDKIVGQSANVINMGMSISSALDRIAFRAEVGLGIDADPEIWQPFFQGSIDDRLLGADWAIFISAPILEQSSSAEIEQGLKDHPNPKFQLLDAVGSVYSNNNGQALVTSTFDGNVDADICTVETHVTVKSFLSVNQKNTLAIDTNIDWDTDTSACTVTAGLLGAVLGFAVDLVAPLAGVVINPITGALAGIGGVLYVKNTTTPTPPQLPNCQAVSDKHLTCTKTINVSDSAFGSLSFDSILPQDDGLSLRGKLRSKIFDPPLLELEVDEFKWLPPAISCGDLSGQELRNFNEHPERFVAMRAVVSISTQGLAPVYILAANTEDDPLNVFTPYLSQQGQQAPTQLVITAPYPGDGYFQSPYPCRILLSTTAGERLVSIDPPQNLTRQDVDSLSGVLEGQISRCAELVDSWFQLFQQYNPRWSVDPAPGQTVDHFYEFEINGLEAGEVASLVTAEGQLLQLAMAQPGQRVQLNALVAPAGANELGLLHQEQDGEFATEMKRIVADLLPVLNHKHRGIAVTQRLLVSAANVVLPGTCTQLLAGRYRGDPTLFTVLEDRLLAFDISNPFLPNLRFTWSVPGIQGALLDGGNLIAFGWNGFSTRTGQEKGCSCCAGAVSGAEAFGPWIYSVGEHGLQRWSGQLTLISKHGGEPASAIARLGELIIVAYDNKLVAYRVGHHGCLLQGAEYCVKHVVKLLRPRSAQRKSILAVRFNGESEMIDFSCETPRTICTFPSPPWFATTAQVETVLGRLSETRNTLQVGVWGRSLRM